MRRDHATRLERYVDVWFHALTQPTAISPFPLTRSLSPPIYVGFRLGFTRKILDPNERTLHPTYKISDRSTRSEIALLGVMGKE